MPIEGFPLLHAAVSLDLHKTLAEASMPLACELPSESIKRAAERLRPPEHLDMDWIPAVVGMMGGAIRTLEMEWPDAPLLVADAPDRFLISLPTDPLLSNRGRDWFLALALAHMSLHWPPRAGWGATARVLYVPRSIKGHAVSARNEAMVFALELLMPEVEFIAAMEDSRPTCEVLGIEVSDNVLNARVRSLGMEV